MIPMLEAVGFRRIRGYLAGGLKAWRAAGLEARATPALDIPGLAERLRSERSPSSTSGARQSGRRDT